MSTRYNNGSHYENHQRAEELHDVAAHAHATGEHREKASISPDTSIPAKRSNTTLNGTLTAENAHGIATFGHADIAALAYELWQARGCPHGSPEEDWFHAAAELRSRA